MTDQPEKFDLRSHDGLTDKQAALKAAFPEVFTEGGKLDFERLRLALGDSVDPGKERYGMNWPGKADCFKTIQQPSMATLVPCPAESWPPAPFFQPRMDANERESQKEKSRKTGDGSQASAAKMEEEPSDIRVDSRPFAVNTSENLIIEGDNLEALKLLQKSYLGKVKMIYIDPPYNTGNDFIYPDNYSESLDTYLRYTGQVDSEGRKYSTNTEADGRFHSKWLNMMYPRLYLARNLLREDGVIFISIDDHEVDNLRKLCNEIFGEENFICTFAWEKRYSPPPDTKEVGYVHESILFYRKSDRYKMALLPFTEEQTARYKNPDIDERGPWKPMDYTCRYTADERPTLYYPVKNPNTGEDVWPKRTRVWAFSKEAHQRNEAEKRIWWGSDGKASVPALKNFLSEIQQGMMPMTLLRHEVVGNTDEATKELREFFPDLKFTPKPVRLMKHLCTIANLEDNDIALDFFGGSGTMAHAVLELSKKQLIRNRFILVQLPEPTDRKDFPTIADITKERVRRVIQKLQPRMDANERESEMQQELIRVYSRPLAVQDLGFKVFKLQSSNFKTWNADVPKEAAAVEAQMEMHIRHIVDGRTQEDLLYEILLKSGFPLTTPIETLTLAGKTVFSTGAMLICLEKKLTPEVIKEMAARKPERVVCLDEGFAGNDQLKTNAVQTMKTKGVTSFRTV